uniref:PK_Tyr_Ser-Thr domain-containing protein n=1 Tax=Macrostomum lignano TaxID=282301 RepID=A0A1I8FKX3_9PLAT
MMLVGSPPGCQTAMEATFACWPDPKFFNDVESLESYLPPDEPPAIDHQPAQVQTRADIAATMTDGSDEKASRRMTFDTEKATDKYQR